MCISNYFFFILKEILNDVEVVSYKFMFCVGMICKLVLGFYIWLFIGLCVLCKVENIVC